MKHLSWLEVNPPTERFAAAQWYFPMHRRAAFLGKSIDHPLAMKVAIEKPPPVRGGSCLAPSTS